MGPNLGANLVNNGAFTAGHSKWTAKCPPANYNNHPGLGDKCASPGGNWSPSGSDKALHMKNGCYQRNRMGWYQDITTVAGAAYAVQYQVADGWFKHKSDKSGQVYLEVQSPVGKQVLDIGEDTGTCLHACKSGAVKPSGNGGWHKAGPYSFVARATKTRIYFYAGGTSCPNLDVIVVKRIAGTFVSLRFISAASAFPIFQLFLKCFRAGVVCPQNRRFAAEIAIRMDSKHNPHHAHL